MLVPAPNCEEMEIVLTFDIPYSSVKEAVLKIGEVIVDGQKEVVQSIIIKHGAFALWAGPRINS